MTVMQRRVLTFIRGFYAENRFPPTLREIGEGCGMSSTSSVRYVLDALEKQGKITRRAGTTRSILAVEK